MSCHPVTIPNISRINTDVETQSIFRRSPPLHSILGRCSIGIDTAWRKFIRLVLPSAWPLRADIKVRAPSEPCALQFRIMLKARSSLGMTRTDARDILRGDRFLVARTWIASSILRFSVAIDESGMELVLHAHICT